MKGLRDNGRSSQLLGRALAYRQLAVAEDSYDVAFLSIFDPNTKEAALYQQVALPFGSVISSVGCQSLLEAADVMLLR